MLRDGNGGDSDPWRSQLNHLGEKNPERDPISEFKKNGRRCSRRLAPDAVF